METQKSTRRVQGFCALCRSRCGAVSVVEHGRLVRLEPDPSHPTGKALCAKGKAAPELVYNSQRILHPMRRTRPKGDPNPGWKRISWDEALGTVADSLRRIAQESGPESVAFGVTSPSGTALSDSIDWIERFTRLFGSPNICYATEICNWHKDFATRYTFGVGIPSPDFEYTECVLLWGHNPRSSWLNQATNVAQAKKRGSRLIVVDPRRSGFAAKADLWLRVRPGTDGALALGIANVMIEEGWFDRSFVRDWTNGSLLVREDTGRFLTEADLCPRGDPSRYAVWDSGERGPVVYDPATLSYEDPDADPALFGTYSISTVSGEILCRPAFDLYAALCRNYPPERVESITWVDRAKIREAAKLLYESRPVSYYAWNGVSQATNATQTDRAISLLYALTGCFDAPGGNVLFPKAPTNDVRELELMPEGQLQKALGLQDRPLGPARSAWVTSDDLYRAILQGDPYRVRAVVGFGANLVMSHADVYRGKEALQKLDFMVHADHFMTPTAELADVVLPVTTLWEHEALRVGFEPTAEAHATVQLRPRVVEPEGEARSDTSIVFELARRVGLGDSFWNGDIEAAYNRVLEPSDISVEDLRRQPGGRIRMPLEVRHRKYAGEGGNSHPVGFGTPTGKIEVYSQTFLEHGYPPIPEFEEPAISPVSRPDLAESYPLVLTCTKLPQFCHSQHRALPSLRKRVGDPGVEMNPSMAEERGIREGDWVVIESPENRISARAQFNKNLHPRVVVGQYGWWQGTPEIDAPAYDPYTSGGPNYNLLIGNQAIDPISGSVPHRSYVCQVRLPS